ncbi:peptidoglycan recognition protein family protein [Companilactobacillus metriopterae]|uniref:peptidoglycan recognition protein family protein n=1 Tax=Companilactobacillus metriopterae TaxID=1909267 RepID=UPI00100AE532|nr:peptidoglycan recognition family protein [Companilactobacillus metriopterae]
MFRHKKFIAEIAAATAIATFGFATYNSVSTQSVQEVQAATSAINTYITNNNIQPLGITNEEGTFTRMFGYRNGIGKPEGVVIHETATPGATARNEATYFNREWMNISTYVHAFVDDKETLNIHNTDYGVWGAGPTANARYIQIELCEVSTTDAFARSVANDAYYTASKLVQYGLPFTPGTTVMSHNDVSKNFGDTDHTDPVGYFSKWGYSMDQFYDLVGTYYNNLKGGTSTGNNGGGTTINGDNKGEGVVQVKNPNGSIVPISVFNDAGQPSNSNRALANNTPWYTDQSRVYNGHTYYRVSTKEWVIDTYATFTAQ